MYNTKSLEKILNIHSKYNVGDIYLGRVINILENINVAFIKLDKWKQNGFMILKNEPYFNKNVRIGEDIVVQIIKEQISKKGPTVTRDIVFEDETIKTYQYNKNKLIFEKKFDVNEKHYLQIITKLIKPKNIGIEIKKKENKINIWEIIQRLKRLEKQSFIIKRKIKNIIDSSCLISTKQEILEILLKKNLIQKDAVIITKSKAEGVKIRKNLNLLSVKKKNFYIEYCNEKIARNYKYYIEYLIKELLKPNIKLNTGGHITIQKTEALTSIDVILEDLIN